MVDKRDIAKLIKKGYSLDLIALEFQLTKLELLNIYKESNIVVKEKNNVKFEDAIIQLKELLDEIDKCSKATLVNGLIEKYQKIISSLKSLTGDQKYQIISLMDKYELNTAKNSILGHKVKNIERKFINETLNYIESKIESSEDLKSLIELKEMINPNWKEDNFKVDVVMSKITKKIYGLQSKENEKNENIMSKNIKEIVEGLIAGEIDFDIANINIENEIKDNTSKFSTYNQKRIGVFRKIGMVISKTTKLNDYDKSYNLFKELIGDADYNIMKPMVDNCINNKAFEDGNNLLKKYGSKDISDLNNKSDRRLGKNLKLAEISDLLIRGCLSNGTKDEKGKFFEMAAGKLSKYGLDFQSLNLGEFKEEIIQNLKKYDVIEDLDIR